MIVKPLCNFVSSSSDSSDHDNWVLTKCAVSSDTTETLYTVTNNIANQGGTRLIPARLLIPALQARIVSLQAAISGEAVTSVTLDQLISFTGAKTLIIKLDVEVRITQHPFVS